MPPQASPPATKRVETLRALGFVESGDGWELSLSAPILFDSNRDDLKPETQKTVSDLANALQRVGIRRVRVEGHTDNSGSRDYNVELSRRRAEAVAREFAVHGFAEDAITRKGWGFEYPAAPDPVAEWERAMKSARAAVLFEE